MQTTLYRALPLLFFAAASCGGARTAPPAAEPEPLVAPAALPFAHALVWTARPGTLIRTVHGEETVRNVFVRFDVLGSDSLGLHVRCARCPAPLEGWISREDVVFKPVSLEDAAGGELADFALAVREAAIQRDLAGLRRLMTREFTYSLEGGAGSVAAMARWEMEGFRSLELLPTLLDHGVATRDSVIWSAPPDFLTADSFPGVRAGFRRTNGRWEWIYFVRGG
ncbi:hypothetical protein BH23GEM3_BH23GEM3_18400 [soil metagenome]